MKASIREPIPASSRRTRTYIRRGRVGDRRSRQIDKPALAKAMKLRPDQPITLPRVSDVPEIMIESRGYTK